MENPAQTVQALERKFWQSLVDQEFSTAEAMLDDTALMVSAHGAMKFDHAGYRQMAERGSMVVKSFELGDMEVLMPTETTAILAYDVRQVIERRADGGTTEQRMHDTSTWVQKNSNWQCVAHTETPAT
jgi:hypothetical protein